MVQSGDTLAGIAAKLGTTAGALATTNDIPDPDALSAGQVFEYRRDSGR